MVLDPKKTQLIKRIRQYKTCGCTAAPNGIRDLAQQGKRMRYCDKLIQHQKQKQKQKPQARELRSDSPLRQMSGGDSSGRDLSLGRHTIGIPGIRNAHTQSDPLSVGRPVSPKWPPRVQRRGNVRLGARHINVTLARHRGSL